MVILDLEVLCTILKKIVGNIKHQKDAQRNSAQKEVLNSSPSFFLASLVKKTFDFLTSFPSAKCPSVEGNQNPLHPFRDYPLHPEF